MIEAMLLDFKPDIAIVSEANIFHENQDFELFTQGYKLVLPDTLESQGCVRLTVLIREGFQVKILKEFMDTEIASVWMKVGKKGGRKMHIGAIYRQHHLLIQPTPNASGRMERQIMRWQKFLTQWKSARERTECFIIGDINLDMNKLMNNDYENKVMMEMLQTQVELMGFQQLVRGDTRFWPNTSDSLVDHCWTNHMLKVAAVKNLTRARSDHNLLLITIRVKGLNHYPK